MMALTAVMVSFPAAVIGAFSLTAFNGLNAGQGLVLYAALGLASMLAILVTSGLSQDD
ncbi:MAG: hypothetical protein HKN18_05735 [Silicimonas sp.]|nr:hypothetical protein [Silicimonas sp.]